MTKTFENTFTFTFRCRHDLQVHSHSQDIIGSEVKTAQLAVELDLPLSFVLDLGDESNLVASYKLMYILSAHPQGLLDRLDNFFLNLASQPDELMRWTSLS